MQSTIIQLSALAETSIRAAISHAPKSDGLFLSMTTENIGGETKPVLMVGNAHAEYDDGHAIVVLNPEESLLSEIEPGVAYGSASLKAIARKRCDLLLDVFVVGRNPARTNRIYRARKAVPARFSVK